MKTTADRLHLIYLNLKTGLVKLSASFSTKFLKTKKILLYSITWPLTLNFHHLVKNSLFPAKLHFNTHWGNFYNMLFFNFKKDLNGQNHSSWDSNHHIKILLSAKFPISPMGRYPKACHRCWEHGGIESIHGGIGGGGVKCCWKISVKEFTC